MSNIAIPSGSPFDAIKRVDERGDHWSARELMPNLEYEQWRQFEDAIGRAMAAAKNSGSRAEDHFAASRKITNNTRGQRREVADYRLTRYGAYLVAMNCDPRKPAVASAQTYFAVKTREAEIAAPQFEIPADYPEALELAARQARAIAAAHELMAELGPKAAQADQHRAADGLMAVGDFANKLKAWAKQAHDVRVYHDDVWDFLGEIGLIIRGNTVRKNQRTAFAAEKDFVRMKETEYETKSHGSRTSASPRLTPAGEGWAWDRAVRRIQEHGSLSRRQIGGTR